MSEYQEKMTEAMKKFPKGISREERGRLFCIAAKIASGKFDNEKEAEQDCIDHPPQPKASKRKGLDAGAIAQCLFPKLAELTDVTQLAKWISECSVGTGGPRIKKPESKNHFIKTCALAGGVDTLKPVNAMKLRKSCLDEWNEKQKGEANVA